MSIKVDWVNQEQSIIGYIVKDTWTSLEMESAIENSFILSETVEHTVDVIVDMRRSQSVPDDALLLFKNALKVLPENRGKIVVISTDEITKTFFKMLKLVGGQPAKKISIVDTPRQAIEIIESPFMKENIA